MISEANINTQPATRSSVVRQRRVRPSIQMADGPQFMDPAVGHPRNGGRVRLSHGQSGARGEVPAAEAARGTSYDRRRRLHEALEGSRRAISDDDRPHRRDGVADRGAAGAAVAQSRSDDRNAQRARVGVRGEDSAAEDAEGAADDSARAACDRAAEGTSRSSYAQERRRSGVPEQVRRTSPRIEAAGARATTGGGTCGAWTGDVASVPPHSLAAPERPARAGQDPR